MHRPLSLALYVALLSLLAGGSAGAQDLAPGAPMALPPAYLDPAPPAPVLAPSAPAPPRQLVGGVLPFRPQLGLGRPP